MKLSQSIKVIIVLFVVTGAGYTWVKGPSYNDVRAMGMGNTAVAVTTDRSAIFHNPAGLCLNKDYLQISATPLAASVDGILFTLLKQMALYGDQLSTLDSINSDFINMINKYDGKWVGFEYLPEITIATNRMGFGIYSVLPVGVRIESGHLIPKLGLRGQRDLVFTWSVGIPLRHKNNYCGVSMAYLQRTSLEMLTSYTETFELFNNIAQNPLGAIDEYAKIRHGMGLTVGFMHELNGFRLAYDIKNGIVNGELVVPQIDLGAAYYFPQLAKVKAIKNLILSAEISDVLGIDPRNEKYEQFWKKTHLGFEFDLHYAALRLGLSQGYPTAGLGVKIGMFKADYAFITKELGFYAGQFPQNKHVLALGVEVSVAQKKYKPSRVVPGDLYNRAMTLFSRKKYYDAFFVFNQILVDYPQFFKNDWVRLYLSLCQENMDMREFASENFKKSISEYPESAIVPYSDLGLLRIAYRNNDSAGVAAQFAKLSAPGVPDSLKYHAWYYQGEQCIKNGQFDRATQLLDEIPVTHPEYVFAQHSLAVAQASLQNYPMAMQALDNVVMVKPASIVEREIINRSYLLLGYIFYEGHGGEGKMLSKAVTALRSVSDSSYYYEDALLGLAWSAARARQWADCIDACGKLKIASKKQINHCDAMLLEGYVGLMNQRFPEAVAVLKEAKIMADNLQPSLETELSAATLENTNNRTEYYKIASEVTTLATTEQSSFIKHQNDSLKQQQELYLDKLKKYQVIKDEFMRKAFFERTLKVVRGDLEYSLVKAEEMVARKNLEKSIEKENKQSEQIDTEVKKMKEELKSLEKKKK